LYLKTTLNLNKKSFMVKVLETRFFYKREWCDKVALQVEYLGAVMEKSL